MCLLFVDHENQLAEVKHQNHHHRECHKVGGLLAKVAALVPQLPGNQDQMEANSHRIDQHHDWGGGGGGKTLQHQSNCLSALLLAQGVLIFKEDFEIASDIENFP